MDLLKSIGKQVISGSGYGSSSSYGPDETWYVTAARAEGIKDKDRFTKSDPYLVVEFGNKSYRTRTIRNDLSPAWNETFTFKISGGKVKDLYLKLKDDDVGIDDTIGTAVVSRADLPISNGEEKYLQVAVKKHEEIRGIVHLRVKKIVEGQPIQQSNSYASSSQNYGYQQPPQQQQYYGQQPSYNSYPPPQQQSSYQSYPPPQQQQQQQQPYYGGQPQYQSYPPPQQQQQFYGAGMPPQQQYPQQQMNSGYSGGYPSQQQPQYNNNQYSNQQRGYPYR